MPKTLRLAMWLIIGSQCLSAAPKINIFTEVDPPNQSQGVDGRLWGMSVEVVQEIQRRVGNTDAIAVVPWARGYANLQGGANTMLFTVARTEERDSAFKWVGPIDERLYALYVRADAPPGPNGLAEARNLGRIGVYRDDARDQILTKENFTNLDRTTESLANVRKLMAKRIDAFASSPSEIGDLLDRAGYRKEDVREALVFARMQGYIAFSKATPDEVVKPWETAFEAMKRDRAFDIIYRKYRPNQPLPGTVPIRH